MVNGRLTFAVLSTRISGLSSGRFPHGPLVSLCWAIRIPAGLSNGRHGRTRSICAKGRAFMNSSGRREPNRSWLQADPPIIMRCAHSLAPGAGRSQPKRKPHMHCGHRGASIVAAAVLVLAALVNPQIAAAADRYPLHPITLIVPFPAVRGVDAVARIVADKLAAGLGQPFVIDNRGGAAGVIGMRLAARSPPRCLHPAPGAPGP